MPVLGTIDYGPILSSINAKGRGGQAIISEKMRDLMKKEKRRQEVAAIVDGGFRLAGTVIDLVKQADLEKAKPKVIQAQAELSAFTDNLIESGKYTIDADGTVQIDPSLKTKYKELREALSETAKTVPVQRWISDQIDAGYLSLTTQASSTLVRRAADEDTKSREENISNLISLGMETGEFAPVERAIQESKFWTDTYKVKRLNEAQTEIKIRLASKDALRIAQDKGPLYAEEFIKTLPLSEEDVAKVRHNYSSAIQTELAAWQGNTDMAIKDAMDSGLPMGSTMRDWIAKAPKSIQADLQRYAEQRRDAAMWEQFQAKANAPGADLMGLYQSIKNNEPGKKGYTGHYEEAQVEQTRELNYLAGILGLEKKEGGAAADKWVDETIAAWKTKVEIGGASIQEAVKFLTGEIFDLNPEKATAAIAYIMKRESPAYADTIRGMGAYIDRIAKDRKLNPTQKEQLEGILRDTLRQSFYDKPNMNAADFAKLQTELTNAVVGKGAEFMTELSKPGWFTSSDDGLGKFIKRMEENPTIANSAAYTEAQFDRNQPYRVVLNPFMADHIRQAQDRGRTLLAEYTGADPGEIVASFQSEGEWDISAIPKYVMKGGDGKERTFILTAPDGKLGFIETTGGKRVPLEAPKKPDKPSAPPPSGVMQSTDLTSIPKDTVSKYIDTDISAKWQEATKGITGRERMALPTTKEAQIRWLISKGVLQ